MSGFVGAPHFRSVSAVQPILPALEQMASHWEACSPVCSNTIRTARSRTSGEYLFTFVTTLSSQEIESPSSPGRFTRNVFWLLAYNVLGLYDVPRPAGAGWRKACVSKTCDKGECARRAGGSPSTPLGIDSATGTNSPCYPKFLGWLPISVLTFRAVIMHAPSPVFTRFAGRVRHGSLICRG